MDRKPKILGVENVKKRKKKQIDWFLYVREIAYSSCSQFFSPVKWYSSTESQFFLDEWAIQITWKVVRHVRIQVVYGEVVSQFRKKSREKSVWGHPFNNILSCFFRTFSEDRCKFLANSCTDWFGHTFRQKQENSIHYIYLDLPLRIQYNKTKNTEKWDLWMYHI